MEKNELQEFLRKIHQLALNQDCDAIIEEVEVYIEIDTGLTANLVQTIKENDARSFANRGTDLEEVYASASDDDWMKLIKIVGLEGAIKLVRKG